MRKPQTRLFSRMPAKSTSNKSTNTGERFKQLDDEVAGVKSAVGVLETKVSNLQHGQDDLKQSQTQGFAELKRMLEVQSSAPPRVGYSLLLTFLGFIGFVVVAGAGAFWASVQLLFSPIKEELKEHKSETAHTDMNARVALIEERSANNREDLAASIESLRKQNELLHAHEADRFQQIESTLGQMTQMDLASATDRAENAVYLKWHNAWLNFLEDQTDEIRKKSDMSSDRASSLKALLERLIHDFDKHDGEADHPFGVLGESQELRGQLEILREQINKIDESGSRVWNRSPANPIKNED